MEKNKDTGLAVTLIFLILSLWLGQKYLIWTAVVSLVLTMAAPNWSFFITPLWFGLSHFLGILVSKVVFTAIFIFLATPIGLIRRILGKDTLGLKKWQSKEATAFKERNHTYTAGDLNTPY